MRWYHDSMRLALCRTVGEQDLLLKSWLPCEQEEFKAVCTNSHQSSWCNAAGLQHWRVILSTLMMDRDGPANPINTKFCYDASSHVHFIPAIPPPTLKQLAVIPNQVASALQEHGSTLPDAQTPRPGYHHAAPALAPTMEPDRHKRSELVLEPGICKQSAVFQSAVRTPMIKVLYFGVVYYTLLTINPTTVNIIMKAVLKITYVLCKADH